MTLSVYINHVKTCPPTHTGPACRQWGVKQGGFSLTSITRQMYSSSHTVSTRPTILGWDSVCDGIHIASGSQHAQSASMHHAQSHCHHATWHAHIIITITITHSACSVRCHEEWRASERERAACMHTRTHACHPHGHMHGATRVRDCPQHGAGGAK